MALNYCMHCGHPNQGGSNFCCKCGKPFGTASASTNFKREEDRPLIKKRKKPVEPAEPEEEDDDEGGGISLNSFAMIDTLEMDEVISDEVRKVTFEGLIAEAKAAHKG